MTGIVILGVVAALMYGVISALEKILLKTHLFRVRRFILKRIIIIGIAVVLVLVGTICIIQTNRSHKKTNTTDVNTTQVNTKEMTLVKVNEVTRSVFYSPQYVAIALGFFEENGIEVELTNGGGADNVMTAVLSGQSDIGFCRTRSINLCL